MRHKAKPENLETTHKNPNNWKGIFYVNRKDPRIIVPKLDPSLGWTLNFGNINAYLGLGAIIIILLAIQFLS